MRIIVITLAILLVGCSNYDSCYDRNFKAYYEYNEGEWDIETDWNQTPVKITRKWIQWSESHRKWQADQYASGQCLNIK